MNELMMRSGIILNMQTIPVSTFRKEPTEKLSWFNYI